MQRSIDERPRIVVVGGVNIDYSGIPEDRTGRHHTANSEPYLGGRAVNYAYQLTRLGVKVCLYGAIGSDANGSKIRLGLNRLLFDGTGERSVDVKLDVCSEEMTGITFVAPKPSLEYFHIPGANRKNELDVLIHMAGHEFGNSDCCIADLEVSESALNAAFGHFRDVENSRPINVLDATYPAQQPTASLLAKTDILIVRLEDAPHVFSDSVLSDLASSMRDHDGVSTFPEFAFAVLKRGPKCVVLSMGASGCLWAVFKDTNYSTDGLVVGRSPGISGNTPYPNSAHAAFAATLAHGVAAARMSARSESRTEFIGSLNWGQICHRATAAYVLAAQHPGASESMPSAREIKSLCDRTPTATRTIMSFDIIDSTVRQSTSTTQEWMEFKRWLSSLVESELHSHSPKAIDWTGDGYWIVFDGAQRAVLAALDLAAKMERSRFNGDEVFFRIGISTGEVVIGDDVAAQGLPVSLAKRAEAAADTNQVVATDCTRQVLNVNDKIVFKNKQEVKPSNKHPNEPSFYIWTVGRADPDTPVNAVATMDADASSVKL